MPIYKIEVEEVVSTRKVYTIEADDVEDAKDKADCGDTIYEEDINYIGVVDRYVDYNSIELEFEDDNGA